MTLAEQLARRERLRKLQEDLRYARSQIRKDWRYASIARLIEADIKALTCGNDPGHV